MKKLFATLFAVVVVFSALFTFAACEDPQGPADYKVTDAIYNDEYERSHYERDDAIAFLQTLKIAAESKDTPSLQKGIKIYLTDPVTVSPMEVDNFVLYLKEVDGVLLAQGSFTMKVGEASAETKIYHDGTYFGMETLEQGQTFKQKEILPVENIGYLVGMNDLIDDIKTYLAESQIDNMIEDGNLEGLNEIKVTGVKNFVVENYTLLSTGVGHLAFDESNNLIAFSIANIVNGPVGMVDMCIECTNTVPTIPADFDSWDVRPNS